MAKKKSITEQFKHNDKEHEFIMEKMDAFKDDIKDDIKKLSIAIAQMPDEIFKRADERYASKTAEKVIYALVGAILLAFVMGLWQLLTR